MRAAFIRQRRHLRRGRIVDLGWLTLNNRQGAAGSCAQSSRMFANVRGDGGAKRSKRSKRSDAVRACARAHARGGQAERQASEAWATHPEG
jgi:hypothetical protein